MKSLSRLVSNRMPSLLRLQYVFFSVNEGRSGFSIPTYTIIYMAYKCQIFTKNIDQKT